ncbi:hypothetical protein BDV19DRAFT_10295 [Aspergillus venezuelensis]
MRHLKQSLGRLDGGVWMLIPAAWCDSITRGINKPVAWFSLLFHLILNCIALHLKSADMEVGGSIYIYIYMPRQMNSVLLPSTDCKGPQARRECTIQKDLVRINLRYQQSLSQQ